VKSPADVAVPFGPVTAIDPDFAPLGTNAWIAEALGALVAALTPLNVTDVMRARLLPEMVTTDPGLPELGAKPLIDGGPRGRTAVGAPDVGAVGFGSFLFGFG